MFIVPIDSEIEASCYVSNMYCMICKERGNCIIDEQRDEIEKIYHYQIVTCFCSSCSGKFNITFYNTSSPYNKKLRKLQELYSYNTHEVKLNN